MCHLNLPVLLIALSVTLSCREAAPIERLVSVSDDLSTGTSDRDGWMLPLLTKTTLLGLNRESRELDTSRIKSRRMEKRKCNTATCVTQRLADYLVRSSNNIGTIYSPTNVGSYTYGKRDIVGLLSREPLNYLQL
ncbi:islet amyloid polypeptide [Ambystoma mexicanum]|uniref:islet amyloid polypeptide n=1 Tax=Ambystoma mexicanum TaxID=8296 RepID=UPI0037E83DC1